MFVWFDFSVIFIFSHKIGKKRQKGKQFKKKIDICLNDRETNNWIGVWSLVVALYNNPILFLDQDEKNHNFDRASQNRNCLKIKQSNFPYLQT